MSTKEKIKQEAAKLFAEEGFEGATLKKIAEKVEIKTPSIYAFFTSKNDIFFSIYKDILQEHLDLMKKSLYHSDVTSVKERLYYLLRSVMEYHVEQQEKTKILLRLVLFPPPIIQVEVSEYFSDLEKLERAILHQIFETGLETGEIQNRDTYELVTAFLCLMDGLFLQIQYYDKETFYNYFNITWHQYWMGLTGNDSREEANR